MSVPASDGSPLAVGAGGGTDPPRMNPSGCASSSQSSCTQCTQQSKPVAISALSLACLRSYDINPLLHMIASRMACISTLQLACTSPITLLRSAHGQRPKQHAGRLITDAQGKYTCSGGVCAAPPRPLYSSFRRIIPFYFWLPTQTGSFMALPPGALCRPVAQMAKHCMLFPALQNKVKR